MKHQVHSHDRLLKGTLYSMEMVFIGRRTLEDPVFYGNGIYWKKNTGGYKKNQVLLEYSFFAAIFEKICLVDLINPIYARLAYCVDAIIPNKIFYIV